MFFPRILPLLAVFLGLSTAAQSQCSGSMSIFNPVEGATVSSHFQINATATSLCSIPAVHVYIDGRLQFAQFGQPVLSGKFNAAPGIHWVVVQAWASDGKVFNRTVRISVNKQVPSTCTAAFDPNVNVCAPVNLAEAKGAVLIHAVARSSISPVVALQVLSGGQLKAATYNDNALEVEAALTLPRGLQNINVVARSSNGAEFQNQTNVQVVSAAATCQAPFISNIVPTPGDAPQFPVFAAAADAAACPITSFHVYADNQLIYSQPNQQIFMGRLTIGPGEHNIILQAWNSQGAVSKKAFKINVAGSAEPACGPNTGPGLIIEPREVTGNVYQSIFAETPAISDSSFAALRIYVDDLSRATFYNSAAECGITFLRLSHGTHKVTGVAWTRLGVVLTNNQMITVP